MPGKKRNLDRRLTKGADKLIAKADKTSGTTASLAIAQLLLAATSLARASGVTMHAYGLLIAIAIATVYQAKETR